MENIEEQWKLIANYDNYEVSNKGRIRNTKTGRILKSVVSNSGYKLVSLCKNGKIKTHTVHRIEMETFKPIDDMKHREINHIDWDKLNNNIDNLEWCTKSTNILHGSCPTQLKRFDALLHNALKKAILKYKDKLSGIECTKQDFIDKMIDISFKQTMEYFTNK